MTQHQAPWEAHHEGAIAPSELTSCPHCVGARLLGLPKTRPFSPAQKRWMAMGKYWEEVEAERLKADGVDFYRGRQVVLLGLALPVRGTPDFLIREGGKVVEVREVKFRTTPPASPPLAWLYQAGTYSLRYDGVPITFAVYGQMGARTEMRLDGPPPELTSVLREWADMLAPIVKEGQAIRDRFAKDGVPQDDPDVLAALANLIADLPHNPEACARSEWSCTDCFGARKASELNDYEKRQLDLFLELSEWYDQHRERIKAFDAAKKAAQEIVLAREDNCIEHNGKVFFVKVHEQTRVDTKALPQEIKDKYATFSTVRRLVVDDAE